MFRQFSQLLFAVRFSEEGGNFLDFSTQILLLGKHKDPFISTA